MKKINQISDFRQMFNHSEYLSLRDLVYAINGVIMNYEDAYAFPELVNAAKQELIALFNKVSELRPLKESYKNNVAWVLENGRKMIASLTEYVKNFEYDNDCVDGAVKLARYQVQRYVKNKGKIDVATAFAMMKRNLLIEREIINVRSALGTPIEIPSFNLLQDDLMNIVKDEANSYAFRVLNNPYDKIRAKSAT